MRILFITSTRIGDAVLSTSVLNHLHQLYPQAQFTLAAGGVSAELFAPFPGLEKLIILHKQKRGGHWLYLWGQVVGKKWDLVVDLRRSALPYLLRAKKTFQPKKTQTKKHKVQEFADMLGIAKPFPLKLWTDPVHETQARSLLDVPSPVLALGPTANWRGKQWAEENFLEVARHFVKTVGCKVAVFGAAHERPMIEKLLAGIPEVALIDLVGKVDLLTAFACLKRCALYIGNDSGLMHLSACSGIPTLGLFGPTDDSVYAPFSPQSVVIRTRETLSEIGHRPDFDLSRNDISYMNTLSVDRVIGAGETLWQQRKAA